MAGAGRTGLLCLICTALADLASGDYFLSIYISHLIDTVTLNVILGHGLIDVIRVAANLCQQRRNMFRDREHLLFAYQALLYHAQDLLMKRMHYFKKIIQQPYFNIIYFYRLRRNIVRNWFPARLSY